MRIQTRSPFIQRDHSWHSWLHDLLILHGDPDRLGRSLIFDSSQTSSDLLKRDGSVRPFNRPNRQNGSVRPFNSRRSSVRATRAKTEGSTSENQGRRSENSSLPWMCVFGVTGRVNSMIDLTASLSNNSNNHCFTQVL